jgi:diguanylate cyclase (GGDEF)-like protein/PAS domain S-box-containing protein
MNDRLSRLTWIQVVTPHVVLIALFAAAVWISSIMLPQQDFETWMRPVNVLLAFAGLEVILLGLQALFWADRFRTLGCTLNTIALKPDDEIVLPWQDKVGELGQLANVLKRLRSAMRSKDAMTHTCNETKRQLEIESQARIDAEDAQQLTGTLFSHVQAGVFFCSPQGVISQVNPGYVTLLGHTADFSVGRSWQELLLPEQTELYQRIMGALVCDGQWEGHAALMRADSSQITTQFSARTITDAQNRTKQLMCIMQDISAQKKAELTLTQLTQYDPLTGLLNRNSFLQKLNAAQTNISAERSLILLHFGIDRLKTINDTLGHAMGDQVLRTITQRVRAILRENDVLARLSGDEFAVLLPVSYDIARAASMAPSLSEKVLNVLRQPVPLDGGDMHMKVTASLGVALAPRDGENSDALMQAADMALHGAKRAGRDRALIYTPALGQEAALRFDIEQGLRKALEKKEFEVFMQPLVEAGSAELKGFECLLRWKRDGSRPVSPALFIPIAEEIGMIERITEWIFSEALPHLAMWRRATQRDLFLSINLSPRHLLRDDLVTKLRKTARSQSIPPSAIVLEITEGGLVGGLDFVRERIQQLVAQGFLIAIDDFGTGHSTLGMLTELPIDKLKIDQSFVRDRIPNNPDAVKVLEAMLALTHGLQLHVVVEGVETIEQARFIRARNPHALLQGYYFDRPQAAMDWDARMIHGQLPKYEI